MKGIMKETYGKLILFCFVFLIFLASPSRAEAATAKVSVSASPSSVTVGDTVTVKVTMTSAQSIGAGDIYLTYDSSILEYVSGADGGGSGKIRFLMIDLAETTTSLSATATFKAIKAGTSSLSIDSESYAYDDNEEDMTISSSGSSVTVKAAYTASSDATLSSLVVKGTTTSGTTSSIALSPSFSKKTTTYTASVSSNMAKAVITATANDSKATVTISHTSLTLSPGNNKVTVKVKAEDGTTKTYTVTIVKEEETTTQPKTTPQETTTPEETSQEETTTPEETTQEETTTPEETTGETVLYVSVGTEEKMISSSFDEGILPEGFELTTIIYNGCTICVGIGIYKELTLCYLTDISGENGALYILWEDGSFTRMQNLQTFSVLYTILPFPERVHLPENFTLSEVSVAGEDVTAYCLDANPEYYLLYAMNWDGTSGYYLYDSVSETMQRYVYENYITAADSATATVTDATPGDVTPGDATPGDADGLRMTTLTDFARKHLKYILTALLVIAVAVVVILAAVAGKKSKASRRSAGEKEPNFDDLVMDVMREAEKEDKSEK